MSALTHPFTFSLSHTSPHSSLQLNFRLFIYLFLSRYAEACVIFSLGAVVCWHCCWWCKCENLGNGSNSSFCPYFLRMTLTRSLTHLLTHPTQTNRQLKRVEEELRLVRVSAGDKGEAVASLSDALSSTKQALVQARSEVMATRKSLTECEDGEKGMCWTRIDGV
jgi:hypothetical protein